MIDAGVRVIDRLIQLIEKRHARREHYFISFVDPVFQDAEVIARDYIALFATLIAKLKCHDEDISHLIRWIEERRMELLPVRIKLRALLHQKDFFHWSQQGEPSRDKFQRGVLGLMKGGLSLTEEGHAPMHEYGYSDHTVLDLLYLWSLDPTSRHRRRYLESAQAQLQALELAWRDAVEGYAELKASYLRAADGR
jgi:hypothetical protein